MRPRACRQPGGAAGSLRQLHRRTLDPADQGQVHRERDAGHRRAVHGGSAVDGRGRRARARRRPRREGVWAETSTTERAKILNKIADVIEENLEPLAIAESWENGKPVRETLAADIPLAADHFRYFAGAIRAETGSISEIDKNTIAYHFHEPLGVVGQIIPFNFPLLMAAWKLAPALAAGNCTVIKPASPTPWSILKLAELLQDVVPRGRAEHRERPGRRGRDGARDEQADREDRLHGRDGDGPPDHAVRRPEHHPVDDRARRQVAQRLLRRRDGTRTTRSSTRQSKGSCSTPSTRARSARVRHAP